MSNKNILEAIEGISDAISSRGSSGGGVLTMVRYDQGLWSDRLMVRKNDEMVPFTVNDLLENDAWKTIPVLVYYDDVLLAFELPRSISIDGDEDEVVYISYLDYLFAASTDTDHAFLLYDPSSDPGDDDGDAPPK